MTRINVLTTEPVPLEGRAATGAGLRAGGLARALRVRGHDVRLFYPAEADAAFANPAHRGAEAKAADAPDWIQTFERARLRDDPRVRDCDVIVLQHWSLARELGELSVPLAIDLAGPHLLERRLWGSADPDSDLAEKLDALRRADFLTTSGRDQRLWFLPWLSMAGWDIVAADGTDPLPVIPFSLPADAHAEETLRAASGARENPRFVFGGYLHPWQDTAGAIGILIEEMDRAGRGELVFIGGTDPRSDAAGGRFDALIRRLREHPRVRFHAPMPYDRFTAILSEGGVALDLMRRNAEREIAFTTRTVQYMACGLPVIHDNYSELGRMIEYYGAGWTLDPDDAEGLRELLAAILSGGEDTAAAGARALRMVADELDPDRTIEPLDRFCRAPRMREGKILTRLAFENQQAELNDLRGRLRRTESELATLRGKRWVRWGLRLFTPRGLAGFPVALLAALLSPVLWVLLRVIRPK